MESFNLDHMDLEEGPDEEAINDLWKDLYHPLYHLPQNILKFKPRQRLCVASWNPSLIFSKKETPQKLWILKD
jgi:hypothetical protein